MKERSSIQMADQIDEKRTTIEYELYQKDASYKSSTNLIRYIDEAQNFYDGNPYKNKPNKGFVKVSMNICSLAAQIKASKICGTPIYLTFTAEDASYDCTGLRQFDEYNCNKLKMKTQNYQAALNGFVNGTEITYQPWDEDDTTYKGIYKGGLRIEHIDPRNFAVENNYLNQSIQNQKWVMFWDDYDVEALLDMVEGKDKAEIEKKRKLLLGGDMSYGADSYMKQEHINHKLVTMFTRFFRVNGEVYFMCSTEKVNLFEYPHPLSKKVGKKVIKDLVDNYRKKKLAERDEDKEANQAEEIIDYDIDYEDLIINSVDSVDYTEEKYTNDKEKFSLYPFAVYEPHKQNRSFWGRSDIKGLMPLQLAMDYALSMTLKCAENNAYNKIFAKEDALGDQIITNEPSQVIYDHSSFTNGWGIKMAESQPLPNGLIEFSEKLFGLGRTIYGFSDVMDGTVTNQDMSGYMLQQMIKQSNTTIEQQQQLFWEYQEELASIRLLYYKHYVDEARYTTELSEDEYQAQEQTRDQLLNNLGNGMPIGDVPIEQSMQDLSKQPSKYKVGTIKNEDLVGHSFDISVDAIQGLADSKLVEQQTWDNLILNGGIQNIDPTLLSLYLQAAPNISPRTKAALKNVVRNLEQRETTQLKQQLQELMQKTQQVMGYAQQLEAQTGYQSNFLKNLQSEFSTKINAQNQIINGLTKQLDKVYQEQNGNFEEGQVKSQNATGNKGNQSLQ